MISENVRARFYALLLIFSFVWVTFFCFFQYNIDLSLWDEGYLWYGAQRVLHGEVPILDFMAYDPGRYYWSSAFMKALQDNSPYALRVSLYVLQIIGLWYILFLLCRHTTCEERVGKRYLFLFLCFLTSFLWMMPKHKTFDLVCCIFLMGSLSFLLEKQTNERFFMYGLTVGCVAVFGRNHGLYGLMACILTFIYLKIYGHDYLKLAKSFFVFCLGVFSGYLPIIAMSLCVTGFFTAFIESIVVILQQKNTNLMIPIPWPWSQSVIEALPDLRHFIVGCLFLCLIAYICLSWISHAQRIYRHKTINPLFLAASMLALPYAHFAFSRADISHLAQGIFPLLVGFFVWIQQKRFSVWWPLLTLFTGINIFLLTPLQPYYSYWHQGTYVKKEILGKEMYLSPPVYRQVTLLEELISGYAPNGTPFLVMPYWPGAYALFDKKAPVWEIYALWPREASFETVEIEKLRHNPPGFVLIDPMALDGLESRRYTHTHPLEYRYVLDHFQPLKDPRYAPYQVFITKNN